MSRAADARKAMGDLHTALAAAQEAANAADGAFIGANSLAGQVKALERKLGRQLEINERLRACLSDHQARLAAADRDNGVLLARNCELREELEAADSLLSDLKAFRDVHRAARRALG